MNSQSHLRICALRRQHGMATILIALFIGVAVAATALSVLHTMRSTQERQITVHAQTHAQSTVWAGMNALRAHLESFDEAALLAFATAAAQPVAMGKVGDDDDTLFATVNGGAVSNGDGTYNVTVNLAAVDTSAQASSNMEVVYKVTPGSAAIPHTLDAAAGFYGDLNMSGGLEISGPGAGDINIQGNLVANGSIGGDGLGHVKSTGDVLIASNISADSLTANGNIVLTGSASGDIYAAGYPGLGKGNIALTASSTSQKNLYANGNLLLAGTTPLGVVDVRGYIEATQWPGSGQYGVMRAANDDITANYFAVELNEGETFQDRLDSEASGSAATTYGAQMDADSSLRPYFAQSYTPNSPYSYSSSHFDALEAKCADAEDVNQCENEVGKLKSALTGSTSYIFNRLDPADLEPATVAGTPTQYSVNKVEFKDGPAEVHAKGPVTVTGYSSPVGIIESTSGVSCSSGWPNYTSIVAPIISGCNSAVASAAAPVVNEVAELTPFVMPPPPVVDAWTQKGSAHYAFVREGNKTKVTVRAINGIANGDYYLGTYTADGDNEYICNQVNGSNKCTLPASMSDAWPMCGWGTGTGTGNQCLSYTAADEKWTLKGAGSMAPGILWFEGDLEINSGNLFNTVVVTGDVKTSGNYKGAGVNFSGIGPICQMTFDLTHQGINIAPTQGSNHTTRFADQYPTDVCPAGANTTMPNGTDDRDTDFNAASSDAVAYLSNAAFLAGGYEIEGDLTSFSGGSVVFGSSAEVMGTVLSADVLDASGSATIYGYISAAGQGGNSSNRVTAGAKINLNDLPPLYADTVPSGKDGSAGTTGTVEVLWTRYR